MKIRNEKIAALPLDLEVEVTADRNIYAPTDGMLILGAGDIGTLERVGTEVLVNGRWVFIAWESQRWDFTENLHLVANHCPEEGDLIEVTESYGELVRLQWGSVVADEGGRLWVLITHSEEVATLERLDPSKVKVRT